MNAETKDCLFAGSDERQRARLLHGSMRFAPAVPLGVLAGCAAIVLSVWPVTTRAVLTSWFNLGLLLVAALWVGGHALQRRQARAIAPDERVCRRWLLASALATGTFWGITSIVLLPPDSLLHQSLLAVVIASVTALWFPLFALQPSALVALAVPALLPVAFALLVSPTAAPLAPMGSLLLFVFAAFLVAACATKRMLEADQATQRALYHRATHDSLVGLTNHGEFHRCMALLEAAPSGPYAVVFIDLDYFKEINDSCGHLTGDRVLQQVGAILREEKRKSDIAARVGGDEFAILMELCNDREALRVATAVLRRINELTVHHGQRTTASIGIACSAPGVAAARTALEAADRACYAAKSAGRNRIVLAGQGRAGERTALTIEGPELKISGTLRPLNRVGYGC